MRARPGCARGPLREATIRPARLAGHGSAPVRGDRVRDLGLELPPDARSRWRAAAQALALRRRLHAGGDAVRRRRAGRADTPALVGGRRFRTAAARETTWPGAVSSWRARGWSSRTGMSASNSSCTSGAGVDIALAARPQWIWTRKQANVPVRGGVASTGERSSRTSRSSTTRPATTHTTRRWRWSAGHGRLDGRPRVAGTSWTGVHDGDQASERRCGSTASRTRSGRSSSRTTFRGRRTGLEFSAWSARTEHTNLCSSGATTGSLSAPSAASCRAGSAGRGLRRDGGARCPLVRRRPGARPPSSPGRFAAARPPPAKSWRLTSSCSSA